ncbi:MAG: 30S ribosome-binding factor RbfA [Anaerolineae bacterium]|nr:30S ribosome-binding factor RbfA [Anaerolineae bacterium]
MATRRQRRVAEQIHRDLSLLLMREVRDPRLGDVTITEVRVTPDLLIARIFFTVLGNDAERKEAQAGLDSAAGFLRSQLAAQLRLRTVPELIFELDRSAEYGQRIEELLSQIALEDPVEDGSDPE